MTIEQAVLENFRELPADKQQEVLDFIQFLKHKYRQKNAVLLLLLLLVKVKPWVILSTRL